MSAYDDAVAYLDAEVHPRCDYEIYSDMRDIVDEMEAENERLRELVRNMLPFAEVGMDDSCVTRRCCLYEQCITTVGGKCLIEAHMLSRMRELGVEMEK